MSHYKYQVTPVNLLEDWGYWCIMIKRQDTPKPVFGVTVSAGACERALILAVHRTPTDGTLRCTASVCLRYPSLGVGFRTPRTSVPYRGWIPYPQHHRKSRGCRATSIVRSGA